MTTQTANTRAKLGAYFRGVRAEMKKVIWPSKKQLINYTAVVVAISILIALIVYGLDLGIHGILSLFIK